MLSRWLPKRFHAPAGLLLGIILLSNCAPAALPVERDGGELPLETLWTGNQSRHAAAQSLALYVTDPAQLEDVARVTLDRAAASVVRALRLDWHREALVCLFMGSKSSGGYGLRLAAPAAAVSHGTAVVMIHWRQPTPGALVTQQLTSPCLIFKLPNSGYDRIDIRDRNGKVRFRLMPVAR